ncbi:MAG: hypothetical protein QHH30_08605 [candidate division NC10 bacterium]|nr:hypothetical protein [candidate division NC10 bacterium]
MPIERKKARLMVQAMAQMGYDAYNLGLRELAYGQDFIKTQTDQWKVPLLCANLIRAKDGKPFATPYLIKDLGGVRLAVLGLMSGLFNAHKYRPEDEELLVQDPVEAASQLVPRLANQAEVVVVLGHLTMEEAEALADRVPGIQAIILAWAMGIIDPPVQIKKTLILSAGTKGSHLGELYLHLNWEKRVISHYSRITPLARGIPEDPGIRELITSYGLAPPAEEPPPSSQELPPKI